MGPAGTLSAPWQRTAAPGRARDWAEIQERMLVPLIEAVYRRIGIDARTRMLGLGCGSGLALLMARGRGATVRGVEEDESRLGLARERLRAVGCRWSVDPGPPPVPPCAERAPGCTPVTGAQQGARLGRLAPAALGSGRFDVVTAFDLASASRPGAVVVRAGREVRRGGLVVLTSWGPPEHCELRPVLQTAARLARTADPNTTPPYGTPRPPAQRAADERGPRPDPFALSGRDTLERLAARAGLRPAGSGRVDCPFGYADSDSAVRGLISTGLFDTVAERIGEGQSEKELAESLHPFVRADGTVRMRHVFRYVLAARP